MRNREEVMTVKSEVVDPNIRNFIKSLRDVGYTFEIAVADILDNSISAQATNIDIHVVAQPVLSFALLDNGCGMQNEELVEAMRLSSKDPDDIRDKTDLGRFGLGLKTASFSQCKKLTVISKKDETTSIKQWDLDFISRENKWLLTTPDLSIYMSHPLLQELCNKQSGTLVIWENIDRYRQETFATQIDKLRNHLSLVFHRFLEGINISKRLRININNKVLPPFNPFNANNFNTYEKPKEHIVGFNSEIIVTPYILPHHSKLSQDEWEKYATEEGYIKSQGFYLYRAGRLLIHGTWWGLHKASDAHKLVRIKIDIPNDQDELWGIDIKKSKANPVPELKQDLKRIITAVTKEGIRPFTKRGRRIIDKTTTRFWSLVPEEDNFSFNINKEHPLYKRLIQDMSDELKSLLEIYLKGIVNYLPIEAIQAQLQQTPHQLHQNNILSREDIDLLIEKLKESGVDEEYIKEILKTEIYNDNKDIFNAEFLRDS